MTSVVIPAGVEKIDEHAFYGCVSATFYVEDGAVTDDWNKQWNSTYKPVVWGCTLAEDGQYVVSVTLGENSLSNVWAQDGFGAPEQGSATFVGWATELNGEVVYTAKDIINAPIGTTLYAIWE